MQRLKHGSTDSERVHAMYREGEIKGGLGHVARCIYIKERSI